MKEQEHIDIGMQRCNALISFAIDKAEYENLSDRYIGREDMLVSQLRSISEMLQVEI